MLKLILCRRKRSLSCNQTGVVEGGREEGAGWGGEALPPPCVDVRLIDFAHSTHRGLQGGVEHRGPDTGFLFGLESLTGILREILDTTH